MTDELTHLVKMINQISENQPQHLSSEDAAQNVSEHVNKFWAKAMRKKLIDQSETVSADLSIISKQALNDIS